MTQNSTNADDSHPWAKLVSIETSIDTINLIGDSYSIIKLLDGIQEVRCYQPNDGKSCTKIFRDSEDQCWVQDLEQMSAPAIKLNSGDKVSFIYHTSPIQTWSGSWISILPDLKGKQPAEKKKA